MKTCGALTLILVASASLACGQRSDIRIAIALDESGNTAAIGRAVRFGAEFASAKHRERGTDVSLLYFDDGGDGREAATKGLEIVFAGVSAVIGNSSSQTTGITADTVTRFGIPLVMPVATNPFISESAFRRGYNALLRLVPTNDLQAAALLRFSLDRLSCALPYVIHDGSDYGRDLGSKVERLFRDNNAQIPPLAPLTRETGNPELIPHQDLIRHYQATCVIFAGYYRDAGRLIGALRAAQLDVPIVLTDGSFQSELWQHIPSAPGRVFISFLAPDWHRVPRAEELVRSFAEKYPDSDPSYAPFGADAVNAIVAVASETRASDPGTIAKELRRPDFQFVGIGGSYKFDDRGDSIEGAYYLYSLDRKGANYSFQCITCE